MKGENRYLWILNNFVHDLATGVWAACLLVAALLERRLAGMPPAAVDALRSVMWSLLWLAIGALAAIAATGGLRLGYWRRQAEDEDEDRKRRALLVKHAAFVLVYGVGTWWLWSIQR